MVDLRDEALFLALGQLLLNDYLAEFWEHPSGFCSMVALRVLSPVQAPWTSLPSWLMFYLKALSLDEFLVNS